MSTRSSRISFLFIVALLLVVPSLLGRAPRPQAEKVKTGGTLRVRTFTLHPFKPEFDPAGGAHVFILNQIYDGLVKLDKNLSPVGALADYWMISQDGRTYTFFLRKGVKFHNGRELEAEDVKFSLERLVHRETEGAYYQFLAGKIVGGQEYREGMAAEVTGFKVRDKYTFEILWKNPYVSALYLLSMDFCKILPRDLVQGQGRGFFKKPVGTGPFKFAYWLRSSKLDIIGVRLERNDDYYSRKAYLEAVEFSPFYTPEEFLEEKVDIVPYTSRALAAREIPVLEGETFTTAFLLMSCHLAPLSNSSVRRAISMAVDKKEIAKAAFRLDRNHQVTNNFIPPRLPGFYPEQTEQGPNLAEAKKILLQEGFSGEKVFPRFTLFVNEGERDSDVGIYDALKDQLAGLGISLRLRTFRTWDDIKPSTEPYLVLLHWGLDFPDPENIVLPLFVSSAALNQSLLRYSNPRLDELARLAEVEQSRTVRTALFHKIEDILHLDIPAVPLFSLQHRLAIQPYVRAVKPPPLGFFYLDAKDIWLDK